MTDSEALRRPPGEDREDRHMVHVHVFNTLTLVANDHQHIVQGVTGPARCAGTSHIHRMRVRTSFYDGHWHWFDVMTGPAVETMDGGHVHPYEGETSYDDGHSHDVADTTAQAPSLLEEEEDLDEMPVVAANTNKKNKGNKR
ncbi:MAG: YmaF family protein [Sporomusaceae bacterium]|nr:YmaF family protein [Sporomusaceae bacterium]